MAEANRRSGMVQVGDIVVLDRDTRQTLVVVDVISSSFNSGTLNKDIPYIKMDFYPQMAGRSAPGSVPTNRPIPYDTGCRLHNSRLIELKVLWEFRHAKDLRLQRLFIEAMARAARASK